MKIKIKSGNVKVEAELNESYTAKRIFEKLPFSAIAKTWGGEVYFSIPVHLGEEKGREEVEVGDVAYWPDGNAFCIFFGRTFASKNDKPRAASKVNIFGKIVGDTDSLKKIEDGTKIIVERA